ncbi:hypothetical protein O988_04763 [Pseudogymnoascus sp. VKM F-3808]|nr:hypothetical protein O988_04763 [Pseudogymnoascus sp. VKM F-3808]
MVSAAWLAVKGDLLICTCAGNYFATTNVKGPPGRIKPSTPLIPIKHEYTKRAEATVPLDLCDTTIPTTHPILTDNHPTQPVASSNSNPPGGLETGPGANRMYLAASSCTPNDLYNVFSRLSPTLPRNHRAPALPPPLHLLRRPRHLPAVDCAAPAQDGRVHRRGAGVDRAERELPGGRLYGANYCGPGEVFCSGVYGGEGGGEEAGAGEEEDGAGAGECGGQ